MATNNCKRLGNAAASQREGLAVPGYTAELIIRVVAVYVALMLATLRRNES
jgi:hypothetical protein